MANTLTGKIYSISPIVDLPTKSGKPFQKRTVILDCSRFDQNTGQKYENTPKLEFIGKNVTLPDGFKAGDIVTISIDINGRMYEKNGTQEVFNSIIGFKIELRQQQPTAWDAAVQQAAQNPPQTQPQPYQPQAQSGVYTNDEKLPF